MTWRSATTSTGQVDRYVSRARLLQMLDKEFSQVVSRLADVRPKNTTFFAYAATVTARSFKQKNECHGWVGIRPATASRHRTERT